MRALHSEPSAEHAATACRAIAQLNAILHAHLDHEERNLEPFAARHASAPQLKRAQAAVRTAHKGSMGTFLAWLTDRADPSAITALRRQIPRPVLFVLTRAGGRRYRRDTASAWS
jgi:hypothetical protein